MRVYVLKTDHSLAGEIERINSLDVTTRFYESDSFHMSLPYDARYIDWIQEDRAVYIPALRGFYGVITTITVETDESRGDIITVEGMGAEYDLYIRAPMRTGSYHFRDTAEAAVRQLVGDYTYNAREKSRLTYWKLETARGGTASVNFEKSATGGEQILDWIEAICTEYGFGYRCNYDPVAKKITAAFPQGVDRTAGQTENRRALFSRSVKNVTKQTYTRSSVGYYNTAYVFGEGEDTDRKSAVVDLDDSTGRAKKEMVVDARDLQQDDGVSDSDYTKLMIARGKEKLAEAPKINTLTGSYYMNTPLGEWVELGDTCTVYDERWGISADMQLTSVSYSWTQEGLTTDLGFGTAVPNLLKKIKRL